MEATKTKKSITGTKALEIIGFVKTLIISGKLRATKNFPLEQLLDENFKIGGDIDKLGIEFGKAMKESKKGRIALDLTDADIEEMLDKSISIKELPEGSIQLILDHKPKKNDEKVSLTLKVSLADEKDQPSIELTVKLSAKNFEKFAPLIKEQYLNKGRMKKVMEIIGTQAIIKANTLEKPKKGDVMENMVYNMRLKSIKENIAKDSQDNIWLYVSQYLSTKLSKELPEFTIVIGLHITDKLTLSVDFKTAATKEAKA